MLVNKDVCDRAGDGECGLRPPSLSRRLPAHPHGTLGLRSRQVPITRVPQPAALCGASRRAGQVSPFRQLKYSFLYSCCVLILINLKPIIVIFKSIRCIDLCYVCIHN